MADLSTPEVGKLVEQLRRDAGYLRQHSEVVSREISRDVAEAVDALSRIAEERDKAVKEAAHLSDQVDELSYAPWPEWAAKVLKAIRLRSGYDGADDADGVDLPQELEEAFCELEREAERHTHEVRADRSSVWFDESLATEEETTFVDDARTALGEA